MKVYQLDPSSYRQIQPQDGLYDTTETDQLGGEPESEELFYSDDYKWPVLITIPYFIVDTVVKHLTFCVMFTTSTTLFLYDLLIE